MNYAEIKKYDVANSPCIGTTLFVSGCTFNCKGCFNKEAQTFTYGKEFTEEIKDKFINYARDENVVNINILGGEPMQQNTIDMLNLVKELKNTTNKNIWMWTGYLFEELLTRKDKIEILKYIDVLVDGRFDVTKRDLTLKFRGSSNQRVIDVQKSLNENKVILFKSE